MALMSKSSISTYGLSEGGGSLKRLFFWGLNALQGPDNPSREKLVLVGDGSLGMAGLAARWLSFKLSYHCRLLIRS